MDAMQHRMSADAIDLLNKSTTNWLHVQWFAVSSGQWEDHESFDDAQESVDSDRILRIKPTPASRPWSKPDDVPGPVCWIRAAGCTDACLVVAVEDTYILISKGDDEYFYPDLKDSEYSTDRKTWHKCEVIE